jgi:hypothetical protein
MRMAGEYGVETTDFFVCQFSNIFAGATRSVPRVGMQGRYSTLRNMPVR